MKHDKDQILAAITNSRGLVDVLVLGEQIDRPYSTLHNWLKIMGLQMKDFMNGIVWL